MRRTVMVIMDGLRVDMLEPERCPEVHALMQRATRFAEHRAVFPSVTRASAASIATGCRPARHGLFGNRVAYPHGAGHLLMDVGPPEFIEACRRLNGFVLRVPTLVERVAGIGGAVVFSNVSPGAAYVHDPDGHGHVYHRAGSVGPGRVPLPSAEGLVVEKGAAGDVAMTARFCDEVLRRRRPPLSVLWLSEPDTTAHAYPLGSPAHIDAMRCADACVGEVVATVLADDPDLSDTLLIVGSDHGMETIAERVSPAEALVTAGLKRSLDSDEVVVATNGFSALVYASGADTGLRGDLAAFLAERPWVEQVLAGPDLHAVGLAPDHGLALAVTLRGGHEPNAHGIPGWRTWACEPNASDSLIGTALHGGLGEFETRPFLLVAGPGFAAGAGHTKPTSLTDLAPTIVRFLGLPAEPDAFDGSALQDAAFHFGRGHP